MVLSTHFHQAESCRTPGEQCAPLRREHQLQRDATASGQGDDKASCPAGRELPSHPESHREDQAFRAMAGFAVTHAQPDEQRQHPLTKRIPCAIIGADVSAVTH